MITLWRDTRNGSDYDIYVQKVDAYGFSQWTLGGVAVYTAAEDQEFAAMTSDGNGGAVITWQDERPGFFDEDIYAQHVNRNGQIQWAADGVAICTAASNQRYPSIASDGSGGAIITWEDNRGSSFSDIYAQRINSSGVVQWATDGIAICTANNSQKSPQIISDDLAGWVITWYDKRSGDYDIYAQRIDIGGNTLRTANGVTICSEANSQTGPRLISDGSGGSIIVWGDSRTPGRDIYAQRINSNGVGQWTANGVAICTAPDYQSVPEMISDGYGGAIMVWADDRDLLTGGDIHIYAQWIDGAGQTRWDINGKVVSSEMYYQCSPTIASDGIGGAIIAWDEIRVDNGEIYAQRVNRNGDLQWISSGLAICTASGSQTFPQIVSDDKGGGIIAWRDGQKGSYKGDIFAQRLLGNGDLPATDRQYINDTGSYTFTDTAVEINFTSKIGSRDMDVMELEDFPVDYCGPGNNADIYWSIRRNRIMVYTADITFDYTGHLGSMTESELRLFRHDGSNWIPWDDITLDQANNKITANNVSSFSDWTIGDDDSPFILIPWNEDTTKNTPVCVAGDDQNHVTGIPDGQGGKIIVWQDDRNGSADTDIYAQKLDAYGFEQWTSGGVAVCNAPDDQWYPEIIGDGSGGVIITWQDARKGITEKDIYAQRINSSGVVQWTANGVAICTAAGDQYRPVLINDGAGGTIITWEDLRNGSSNNDIFAQKVNNAGMIQWTTNGLVICDAVSLQQAPVITSDQNGGAIITWMDYRSSQMHIYAQRVSGGAPQWIANGLVICNASIGQGHPTIVSDDGGGAIITWMDYRNSNYDLYTQRVLGNGDLPAANRQAIHATTSSYTFTNTATTMNFNSLTGSGDVDVMEQEDFPGVGGSSNTADVYWTIRKDSGIISFNTNITFDYTGHLGAMTESELNIYRNVGDGWVEWTDFTLDQPNNKITATILRDNF